MTEKPRGIFSPRGSRNLVVPGLAALFLVTTSSLLQLARWPQPGRAAPRHECVVLLHGLGRSAESMRGLAAALELAGYRVAAIDYPSRKHSIARLSDQAVGAGLRTCLAHQPQKIHLVGHSMGGILARRYFREHGTPRIFGRLVMLGPPNRGSVVAQILGRYRWFGHLMGPAALELGRINPSQPTADTGPEPATGVIAGTRSSDPWFSPWLVGPDDGKVSVRDAALPAPASLTRVAAGHSFLPRDPRVIELVLDFLDRGGFRTRRYN